MKWARILRLGLIFFLLASSPLFGFGLPNGDTQITGQSCTRAHTTSYRYTFTYPDEMVVGEPYELVVAFKVGGSTVTKNPYTVSAVISGSGFTVEPSNVNLLKTNRVRITPTTETPSISVETRLVLDGDVRQHRGYEAVYRDVFKLTEFNIVQPVIEPPIVDNSIIVEPDIGENITVPVPPSTDGQVGSQVDPPVHTDTPTDTVDTVIDNVNGTDVSGYQKDHVTMISIHVDGQVVTTFTVGIADLSEIPWYIVRVTGFISFYLLSLSVFIALLKKINPRKFARLTKYHHEVSWMAVILSVFHGLNNLVDGSVWSLSVSDVFWVDFSSSTASYISLGVISMYLIVILSVTSFKSLIKALRYKKWYVIHIASYVAYGIVILHSVMLGTDMSWLDPANSYSVFANYLFWLTTLMNITGIAVVIFTGRER